MEAIYHTSVNELSIYFLEMLKKQFANAKIDIDYLNSSTTI